MLKRSSLLVSFALLANLALPRSAHAAPGQYTNVTNSLTAFGAVPANAAEASCWQNRGLGYMVNVCAGPRRLYLPVVQTDMMAITAQVVVYGATPNNWVGCFGMSTWDGGWSAFVNRTQFPGAYGSPQHIALDLIWTGGNPNSTTKAPGVFIVCDVAPGGEVRAYTFNSNVPVW